MQIFNGYFYSARKWIRDIVNNDCGWGDHEGDESTVVNTAEALLALKICGEPLTSSFIQKGVRHLEKELEKRACSHLEHARDYSWAGIALTVLNPCSRSIQTVVKWLETNQVDDGYWEGKSTYETAIALRFLVQISSVNPSVINKAKRWLSENAFTGQGWSRYPGEKTNLAITAHVIYSLKEAGLEDEKCKKGKQFIIGNHMDWTEITEDVQVRRGPLYFRHFTLAWVLAALLHTNENARRPEILGGIKELLSLRNECGGWTCVKGEKPRIWPTHNAALALEKFQSKLDISPEDIISLIIEKSRVGAISLDRG